MTTGEREAEGEKQTTALGIGWRVYQHLGAIVGAFAFLALLTNIAEIDWRGWLDTLIGAWDQYVRPPVQWALHYVIEVPLSWVGWDVEVPQWLRDYVAVGIVLAGSLVRSAVGFEGSWRNAIKWAVVFPSRERGRRQFTHVWLPFVTVQVLVAGSECRFDEVS